MSDPSGVDAADGDPIEADGATGTATDRPDREEATDEGTDPLPEPERAVYYLQWAAVGLLVLFALVAAVSLYTNVSRTIEIWVTEEYQPVVNAAFNLAVFALAALGVSVLLRRLAAHESA